MEEKHHLQGIMERQEHLAHFVGKPPRQVQLQLAEEGGEREERMEGKQVQMVLQQLTGAKQRAVEDT